MSEIIIQKISITELHTDAIVNAANTGLWEGGGVCGAIFHGAGREKLTKACNTIGHCETGHAVITEGFDLPARYVIHAVGPVWKGGNNKEPELLYGAYKNSLDLAMEYGCKSIGFPLISAGIYGYPPGEAWRIAMNACRKFIEEHPLYNMEIVFAVLDNGIMRMGLDILNNFEYGCKG